jgi:ABC-type uncharacterized transport system permease subunit
MKFFWRLLLFASIIAAINAATYFVLRSNQAAGLYNASTDAIGLPLSASFELSKYVLLWLVPICAVTSLNWPYALASTHQRLRPWLIALLLLSYLWLAWLFFGWGVIFWRPNHYLLAALCSAAAVVPLVLGILDIRRVRSNNSFKPKPLRGSA